jgi:hypothetical protein
MSFLHLATRAILVAREIKSLLNSLKLQRKRYRVVTLAIQGAAAVVIKFWAQLQCVALGQQQRTLRDMKQCPDEPIAAFTYQLNIIILNKKFIFNGENKKSCM